MSTVGIKKELGIPESSGIRTVDSKDLFVRNREIRIKHQNSFYRLMITKMGKLILTK